MYRTQHQFVGLRKRTAALLFVLPFFLTSEAWAQQGSKSSGCNYQAALSTDLDTVLAKFGVPSGDFLLASSEAPPNPFAPPSETTDGDDDDAGKSKDDPCTPAKGKNGALIRSMSELRDARDLDRYAITLATGKEITSKTISDLNDYASNDLLNDAWWGIPQYYDRGAEAGYNAGKRLFDNWLAGMQFAKSLVTADPTKGSALKQAAQGKVIGDLTGAGVDHLQSQLKNDSSHNLVRAARAVSTLSDTAEGYATLEDPVRRAARIGFDSMLLPLQLIEGDLKSNQIRDRNTRLMAYTAAELYVLGLPPCSFGDEPGSPRTKLPKEIVERSEGGELPAELESLAWLVQHLWAKEYVKYRRAHPRGWTGFRLPKHGEWYGEHHGKSAAEEILGQRMLFSRDSASWVWTSKGEKLDPQSRRLYQAKLPNK